MCSRRLLILQRVKIRRENVRDSVQSSRFTESVNILRPKKSSTDSRNPNQKQVSSGAAYNTHKRTSTTDVQSTVRSHIIDRSIGSLLRERVYLLSTFDNRAPLDIRHHRVSAITYGNDTTILHRLRCWAYELEKLVLNRLA